MSDLYTNQGSYFGYRLDGYLFTYKGICVGKFMDGLIYKKDGCYLGELSKLNYLVVDRRNRKLSIDSWDHVNGEEVKIKPFQFSRVDVSSFKYVDFPEVEEFI